MTTPHTRKDSPHHHVSVMVEGKRIRKTTGLIDKEKAEAVAIATQNLADNILSPSQEKLKRLCGAVFDAAGVTPFWENEVDMSVTFPAFTERWLEANRKMRMDLRGKYVSTFVQFARHYGERPIRSLKTRDIEAWTNELAKTNSPATVKQKVGMLASALDDAVSDRILATNPARKFKVEGGGTVEKRELSDEDYNHVLHYLCYGVPLKEEWLTAIDLARWNGLRLMDAVNIGPENVKGDVLDFVCSKTKERMVVPLHPFAKLRLDVTYCNRLRLKSKSQLSQTFTRFLERAGIENPVTISPSGRELRRFGFHSLRHSFITWMKKSGVPEEVRMALSGHKSRKIHAGYSHTDPIEEARKLCPW